MKKLIMLLLFSNTLFASNCDQDGIIDPNFYNECIIEHEGHLYKILLMQHMEECPCDIFD